MWKRDTTLISAVAGGIVDFVMIIKSESDPPQVLKHVFFFGLLPHSNLMRNCHGQGSNHDHSIMPPSSLRLAPRPGTVAARDASPAPSWDSDDAVKLILAGCWLHLSFRGHWPYRFRSDATTAVLGTCSSLRTNVWQFHLQTKSFQYCVQNCAIYAYIGTITQYIQYVQYVQCLYTILNILFAQQYCIAVLHIILHNSIAHHIAYICVQYDFNLLLIVLN